MSSKAGTQTKKNKQVNNNAKGKRPQPTAPRMTAEQAEAVAAQEAARREARAQRQAVARAEAARKQRTAKVRNYSLFSVAVVAVVALIGWSMMKEANKPGEAVEVMAQRNHLQSASEAHAPYSTTPPTSGPHTSAVPQFKIYDQPLANEEAVHGLEDGAVIINYKPDLDQATLTKLKDIAQAYIDTPGKNRIIMTPYPGLTDPVVLTTWGRMERLPQLDEAKARAFIEAYVNIDHHEGNDGTRLP